MGGTGLMPFKVSLYVPNAIQGQFTCPSTPCHTPLCPPMSQQVSVMQPHAANMVKMPSCVSLHVKDILC